MYSGKVTNSKNGTPISNVPVSDGRNVTLTDENGYFELEGWERARVISVNILTESLDDWYINVDKHEGDFDFSLSPAKTDPDNFCFLHISDTELLPHDDNTAWLPFAKDTAEESAAAFFLHTGDIAREYGLYKHRTVMNEKTVGCPVRYAIGNHDFTEADYGEQLYEKLYGPTFYSFDCGKIHFVVLSIAGIAKTEKPTLYKRDDQLIWLKNDLSLSDPQKKLIILCHTFCENDPLGFCLAAEECSIDLKKHDLIAWIYGHTHVNYLHNVDGILYINSARPNSGGVDSSEGAIRKISLSGTELSSEMIYCCPKKLSNDSFVWEQIIDGKIRFCPPVQTKDGIVIGTSDDGYPKKCGVFKLDTETGKVIWSCYTKNGIAGDLAYDGKKIYAQDSFGAIYCIDERDGHIIWSIDDRLSGESFTKNGVLLADTILITGKPKQIRAYDVKTRELVWTYEYRKGESTPARMIYDESNRQVLISANWYGIVALDIDTGKQNFIVNDRAVWFRTSTPIIIDGLIFVTSHRAILKIDASNGTVISSAEIPDVIFDVSSPPSCADGILYAPSANAGVLAFDMQTLKEIHRFPSEITNLYTSPYISGDIQTVESQPLIKDDLLIFSASDGAVWFYEHHTGKHVKTVQSASAILSAPILLDDHMIVACFDGSVKKFKI